jgi:transposase
LAALVQQAFGQDPFCGAVYLFRGKRGRLIKCNRCLFPTLRQPALIMPFALSK